MTTRPAAPERSRIARSHFTWFTVALVVLGALLLAPALGSGQLADDYRQTEMLDGTFPAQRSPLDLYSFVKPGELEALVNRGLLPWWSHPQLKLTALRPLSSALISLDHRVLGLSPWARHAHSLLWWSGLVVVVAILFRQLLPGRTALLAAALFAFDPAHVIPVSWLANRSALVSALFGALGFLLHVRSREGVPSRRLAWLSASCLGLALAGGEYGLSAFAYLASYELTVPDEPWSRRAKALLPAAAPALVYLLSYALLGFGTAATATYVSPLSAPREFALHAAVGLPSLLAGELFLVPPELGYLALSVDYRWLLAAIVPFSAVGLLVIGTIRRSGSREARLLACFALGMLLALLPLAGTLPTTRLLSIPSLGGSVVVAALFADGWQRLRARVPGAGAAFWIRTAATLALPLAHLSLSPIVSALGASSVREAHDTFLATSVDAEIDDRAAPNQDVIVINAPDPVTLLYVPEIRREQGHPMPRSWRALAMTPRPVRVRRVAPYALELTVEEGSLTEMPIASLVRRSDLPLAAGETVRLERLTIRVIDAGPAGPRRVQYHFHRDLDSPSLAFLLLLPQGLRRMPPLGVGAELVVAPVIAQNAAR